MKKMYYHTQDSKAMENSSTAPQLVPDATNRDLELILYSDSGSCEHLVTRERRCAMQSSDCEPSHIDGEFNERGEKFVAGTRVAAIEGTNKCNCENTPVGICMKEGGSISRATFNADFRCAANAHACGPKETFLLMDDWMEGNTFCTCNGLSNKDGSLEEEGLATLYGACQDKSGQGAHFCAYSPESCEEGHEWVSPPDVKSVLGLECHCENVRVGGCINALSGFHCANTADDCGWGGFLAPVSLEKESGESCRLCTQVSSSLFVDEIDTIVESGTPQGSSSGGGKSTNLGLAVAIPVVAVCVISVIGFLIWRRRAKPFINSAKSSPPKDSAGEEEESTRCPDHDVI